MLTFALVGDLRESQRTFQSYYHMWVLASRYMTIRALLRDHVHVVTMTDTFHQKQDRFYENLRPVSEHALGDLQGLG